VQLPSARNLSALVAQTALTYPRLRSYCALAAPTSQTGAMTAELLATIAKPVLVETIVKRSRFIAQLAPVSTVSEADSVIAAIRKEHWNANHNCVALIVGPNGEQQRSSDDGEPSGTAGVPMLEVLRSRRVTDVVTVVTRYFGGVLLGAGGLVRAYGSAVSDALNAAQLVQRRTVVESTLDVPHAAAGRIDNWLRDWAANNDSVIGSTSYGPRVATFTVQVPPDKLDTFSDALAAVSAGAVVPAFGAEQVIDIPQ